MAGRGGCAASALDETLLGTRPERAQKDERGTWTASRTRSRSTQGTPRRTRRSAQRGGRESGRLALPKLGAGGAGGQWVRRLGRVKQDYSSELSPGLGHGGPLTRPPGSVAYGVQDGPAGREIAPQCWSTQRPLQGAEGCGAESTSVPGLDTPSRVSVSARDRGWAHSGERTFGAVKLAGRHL